MSHRILVVDDEPDMRLILGLTLSMRDHEVTEAVTGEEALEMVAAGQEFDLVLLDLNLPGKSGLEVLEQWQADGVVPGLPVLMLTADARTHLDEESTRRGARSCLRKPVGSESLLASIESAIATPATVEEP